MHPAPHRPLAAGALLALGLACLPVAAQEGPLRVGVYHNPPKILLEEDGAPGGIFGDIAEALAEAEGWELEAVECTWQACLEALEAGELDLMPDVAWTQGRAERLAFHAEPVLHSWSQLYHAPQRPVQEITALDGRRVAVLEGSTQQRYFAQLLRSFGVEAELVVSQEFEAGFEAVQLGAADAVVSNHLFGNWQAPRYGLVASHIMFDPSRLFFAATPGRHEALLERIDERLLAWKLDQDSPYHAAMERWRYGDEAADDLPGWLGWSLGGLVSLLGLALLANLLLRRRLSDHLAAIRQVREDNRRLSLYDSLTGLPNRRHLLNHLRRRREAGLATRGYSALLLIDLDRFKRINDTRSHHDGDRLLYRVAEQLEATLGEPAPLLAHLGADEFALLVDGLGPRPDLAAQRVERLGERLLSGIVAAQPPEMADLGITGSIGVTLFDGAAPDPDTALQQADVAISQAKAAGGNCLRFFDDEIQAAVTRQVQLEADLRRALERDELVLHYQVQVDAQGRLSGLEALLRWAHPERGMISPAAFIPLAEETGLILPIGHWVLESACHQLAAWAREPALADYAISVNVSAVQFREEPFVEQLHEVLVATGAPPHRLVLEVTESLLMDGPERVSHRLTLLRDLGVRLALDDFGTGYSSLNYLKRLSLHELKIDASFVAGIPDDPADMAIVDTTFTLANRLGLEVTAEGVETAEQHRWLRERGCQRFQGYHFGRPMPLGELLPTLRGQTLNPI